MNDSDAQYDTMVFTYKLVFEAYELNTIPSFFWYFIF